VARVGENDEASATNKIAKTGLRAEGRGRQRAAALSLKP
jgi:hypothetical protein